MVFPALQLSTCPPSYQPFLYQPKVGKKLDQVGTGKVGKKVERGYNKAYTYPFPPLPAKLGTGGLGVCISFAGTQCV
jgi:hypothetical protein